MNIISGYNEPIDKQPKLIIRSTWLNEKGVKLHYPSRTTVIYHAARPLTYQRTIRNIYIQDEPESIIPQREFMLNNASKFDYILTWDAYVLQKCRNAIRFVFGGCWVHAGDRVVIDTTQKQFSISTLVGYKAVGEGHRYRHALYVRQKDIPIPYTFYRSSQGPLLPEVTTNPIYTCESKIDLFKTFQYSLAIENSKELNYFTEKLIDCFITKTIPIYWGCPNIGEFFLLEGMICLESTNVDECIQKLSTLTPESYEAKKPFIEENYRRALQYVSVEENINRALRQIPNY